MADGSLKFDTKIDLEGFEKGTATLTQALDRLSNLVEKISVSMDRYFNKLEGGATQASKAVKDVAAASESAQSTQKKTSKTTKELADSLSDLGTTSHSLQDEIDQYTDALYYAEKAGKGLGDEEYDRAYAGLVRAKLAAEQYKKSLLDLDAEKREKASTFSGTIHYGNEPENPLPDDGKRYNIYGQDVDKIIEKNRKLEESMRQTAVTVHAQGAKEEQSIVGLKDSMLKALGVFTILPGKFSNLFSGVGISADTAKGKTRNLQDEIDRYTDALYYAERAGKGLGDEEYDKAYAGLAKAKKAAEQYKKSLLGLDTTQKKAVKSAKGTSGALRSTQKAAIPLTKSILKLSNMFKLMLVRMAMRAAVEGAKEGFENLAQYSDETNKSISMLMSANTRLKNSFATAFAPILHVAAPALKSLIDLLSQGATYAGQFIAALTGKSTFVKAVDVEEDYAESVKDSNAALKEQEEINEKLAFSFDDLIQAKQGQGDVKDDSYVGPTPDQMFETVEVENDIKKFADTVKGVLADLFEPIKSSWNTHGQAAIDAAKIAFSSIKNLAGDVGESFMQVWKTEGYGQKITDDLLITFTNLMLTVANLADRFDEAWKKGDTGTSILRHLGDILLTVSGLFRDASAAIRDWAAKLDFSPLLKSFDNLLAKMNPVVKLIGSALLWLLSDVLLPLGKWALECVIPTILDLIAAGFEVLASVLEALQPLAMWLWETFLQPLGEWAGEVFIAAIQQIVSWLTQFSNWISEHKETVQDITIAVLSFFAAWKVAEFAGKIVTMIGSIGGLVSKLGDLDWKFGAIVFVIGSIIYLAAEITKAWDKMTPGEKLATKLIAVAGAVALVAAAIAAVGPNIPALVIAGSIAAIAGLSIAGITSSVNKRLSSTGMSGGGRPFSANAVPSAMSAVPYRMPRLATGTVVPPRAGEFAAILGDNNRETEVVSPLSTIEQALDNVMSKYMGSGNNQTIKADLILDGTKFGQLVYSYGNKEKQRIGVRMVTEG